MDLALIMKQTQAKSLILFTYIPLPEFDSKPLKVGTLLGAVDN